MLNMLPLELLEEIPVTDRFGPAVGRVRLELRATTRCQRVHIPGDLLPITIAVLVGIAD